MKNNEKIVELDELAKIVSKLKSKGKKVVHCHGVFDLLHVGHIRHFEAAKKFGDILVVTLTQDKYVKKGPHRPAFTEKLRAEAIAALGCVDYVAINKWPTAEETIELLKPDFYAKGLEYSKFSDDYTKGIITEKDTIEKFGGKIIFTDEITFSSSALINRYLHVFPKNVEDFLLDFSKKHLSEDIINYLEKIYDLRILIIGEAIIDEYVYGFPIGKAGKESIIALKYLKTEKFAGGTLATANHLANFSNNVDLFTLLGDKDSQEDFINGHLNKKVNRLFHYKKDAPTIVKRRFLTSNPLTNQLTKLLEYYIINDNEIDKEQSKELQAHLKEILPDYDHILVIDYGHGMFTKEIINLITEKSKFLAVNTQTNAGNMGFNTVSKYQKADYICIDEPEIRFDTREKFACVEDLIISVTKKLSCKKMILTRGTEGCMVYSHNNFISIPAFSEKVVDTMGAGDAFISITSPLVANKVPMEIVGFVGNAVGALKCMSVGNREPIDKPTLYKYITSLMK